MKIPNERTPPRLQEPIFCKISGLLAEHIRKGAVLSGLTPQQYVLSLLWHNVPLKQDKPHGLPECVQLVLNDIYHHYVGLQDPYEEAGMTREDFCGGTFPDDAFLRVCDEYSIPECDEYSNPEEIPF